MTNKNFEAVVRRQPGAATIDLYGDLTVAAGPALEGAYAAAESHRPEVIWLNFAGVAYINSSGIALIIGLLVRVRQSARSLMVYGLCPFHSHLFELAGLAEYMPVLG
jgi:anti-anti-sigma factor